MQSFPSDPLEIFHTFTHSGVDKSTPYDNTQLLYVHPTKSSNTTDLMAKT
jgi:hypothetical protein